MKTLRKGDKGSEVRMLQEKLTAAGYPLNPIDDKFGPNTDTAVTNFQREKKLKVDGVVGVNTWDALEAAIKNKKSAIAIKTLRKGSQGPLVRALQERLNKAGYSIQPMTDYFGIKTDTAIRKLQRKHNLIIDGIAGKNTWYALGVVDSANPDVKPVNSLNSLLAGLGMTPGKTIVIDENAKPVAQLTTSSKGLQFIYTREAWKNKSNRLHWPGGASGVTLGPGYDMKHRSEAEIARDLFKVGVVAEKAKSIAKGAGLKGAQAKEFCKTNRNLVALSDKVEFKLMKTIVPHYERLARKKIKVDLVQHEFDALVSFAYNLGEVWTSMANYINDGKINDAMRRMKAANKSGGKVNDGLTKRRSLEVALYTLGDYGLLRIV